MRYEWAKPPFAEDEKAQILDILNAVAAHEGTNGIPRPLTPEEGDAFMHAVEGAILRGDSHQLLARDENDRIVAFVTLEPAKLNPARKHVVEMKRMAAHPASRGVGYYLLGGWSLLLAKCRELGCDIINIDVSEDGPYRLWEKLGFRIWAKIPDYARVGSRKLDGYYLSVYVDEASAILKRFERGTRAPSARSVMS
jgi:GNAT superfamily N-acetyltransferase